MLCLVSTQIFTTVRAGSAEQKRESVGWVLAIPGPLKQAAWVPKNWATAEFCPVPVKFGSREIIQISRQKNFAP